MTGIRIGGLASGMDIDSIVEKLMTVERMPLQKMEQDRTWLTWQRDAYREMNALLFELDSLAFNMKLSSTYNSKTVTSSSDSVVTAIASANSPKGSHNIKVEQVATAAYKISNEISNPSNGKIDANASLWKQVKEGKFSNIPANLWSTATYKNPTITVGKDGTDKATLGKKVIEEDSVKGKIITVTDKDGNETTFTIVTNQSEFTDTGNEVYLNTETGELLFDTELSEGSKIDVPEFEHKVITFSFTTYDTDGKVIGNSVDDNDGKFDFTFDASASLNQILSAISGSKVGINAFYDTHTDKVVFQRTQTGDLNPNGDEIGLGNDAFFKLLNIDQANEEPPKNAIFTIDGLTTERTSNTFTINGVTYSLKSAGTATISVEDNTEASFEKIKEFVDKYNEIIGKINDKLQEDRYRDYRPLTDEQRKEMSESQIELWEEKAKSGLLKGDSILSSALSNMRMAFYSKIETNDIFTHLSQIGIETTPDYLSGGKLQINESKLKEALAQDSDAVYKLFSNDVQGDSRGIINRLEDVIQNTMDRIETRAGKATQTLQQYTIGRRLDQLNDQIERFQDRLVTIEDRYWRQFTAMEQAIQQMNSQMNYLYQQFAY
jgi:flagellar hook-associated protein 2